MWDGFGYIVTNGNENIVRPLSVIMYFWSDIIIIYNCVVAMCGQMQWVMHELKKLPVTETIHNLTSIYINKWYTQLPSRGTM